MTHVLRGMFRRRFRTLLTILGVGVGIFAFCVMGALAERMNIQAAQAEAYFSRYVWVLGRRSFLGIGSSVPTSIRPAISRMDGVADTDPRIIGPLDYRDLGTPWSLSVMVGIEVLPHRSRLDELPLSAGRRLSPGAVGEVVLGWNVARKYRKGVGDTIAIHRKPFAVVGVLDQMNADPDSAAYMAIEDARGLLEIPPGEASTFAVRPAPRVDAEDLARRIEAAFPAVRTLGPRQMRAHVEQMLTFLDAIVLGSTVVALLVGSLGIINTMVMSVGERAREVATKKAIGASTSEIFREFLTEAILIALVGGALGILLALVTTLALNWHLGDRGITLFIFTPRLIAASFVLALGVGSSAGLYPAIRAARLDPAQVLRTV